MHHNSFRIAAQAVLCAVSVSAAGIAAAQSSTPTLAPDAGSSVLPIDDAAPIEFGQQVEGSLSPGNASDAYTFEAEIGQVFTASLVSEDFDCYLILYDEDGNEVASNDDDRAGNLDSQIGPHMLLSTGSYTLLATSYSGYSGTGSPVGDYILLLEEPRIDPIEYSQTVEGELTRRAPQALYSFSGQVGDTIIIHLISEDFNSYLRLFDPNGFQMIRDEDRSGNSDAQVGQYMLGSTDNYQIRVNSVNGSSTGDFTLSLSRTQVMPIAYGDTVEVPLDNGAAYFAFEGRVGDLVSLRVNSEVDTMLTLNAPLNYNLIVDEDSGTGDNPEVDDFVLNQDGTYLVIVRANDPDAEGSVSLSLEVGEPPSLDEGAIMLSFSATEAIHVVTFMPEAGQTYTLTLRLVSGGTYTPSVVITQENASMSHVSGVNTTRLSFDFTLSSDVLARIALSKYGDIDSSVEVTLTQSDAGAAGSGQG